MVKLGNNFSEKNNGKAVSEDGFDTIPLITPLDASQLQFPPPDKVRFLSWVEHLSVSHSDGVYFYIPVIPIIQLKWCKLKKTSPNVMLMLHIIFECRATQMWFPLEAVTVWTCPIFACVLCFLPGGGKDKGRLWWWEQEGKTTVSQNRRVLNKHHRRRIWATQSKDNVPAIICVFHRSSHSHSHTPPHVCISQRADSSLSTAQDICHSRRNIPLQSILWSCLLRPPSSPASCAACLLVWATLEDIMHNDSLNPALKLSLIQLLPWRWPLKGSIPPACLNTPLVFSCSQPIEGVKQMLMWKKSQITSLIHTYVRWRCGDFLIYLKIFEKTLCALCTNPPAALKSTDVTVSVRCVRLPLLIQL